MIKWQPSTLPGRQPPLCPSHGRLSVCRVWGQAPGFLDRGWAGGGSRALALAGQHGPGLPAHVRGLRAGPALGGDRGALHAQASQGPPKREGGASGAFSVGRRYVLYNMSSCLPATSAVSGPRGVCEILPVRCQAQS